jgi:hypothetical protein
MNRFDLWLEEAAQRLLGVSVWEANRNPSEWVSFEVTHDSRTEANGSETRLVTQTVTRRNGTTYTKDCADNRRHENADWRETKW